MLVLRYNVDQLDLATHNKDHLYVYERSLTSPKHYLGLTNTYGLPVKFHPNYLESSKFQDRPEEFRILADSLDELFTLSQKFLTMHIPHGIIGDGISKMSEDSPRLQKYILEYFSDMFNYRSSQ